METLMQRTAVLIVFSLIVGSPARGYSPDSLGISSGSSGSSHHSSPTPSRAWREAENEYDRGTHRVVDPSTWLLDEIRFNRALQAGHFREFDLLQVERDRQERIDARERGSRLAAPIPAPLPRGDTLRGGYLGNLYDPMNLIYPRAE
jgi:hypothetical protein